MESPTTRPTLVQNHSRSKSAFSFRSHRSSGSAELKPKMDLTETEADKRKNRFTQKTFANPNRAIFEAQPGQVAQQQSTLGSLRSIQHRDWQGNVITDADAANPTRPRLERPLDTIRSFHAAADGGASRRSQRSRADSAGNMLDSGDSRTQSFVGSDVNIHPRSSDAIPRAQGQYPSAYGSRRTSMQRDPYDQYPRGPPSSYRRNQRMSSGPSPGRPYSNSGTNGYDGYNQYPPPIHHHNDSYDTNADSTGSPSEPWGTSTDPSSENSSIDRINAYNGKQPDRENDAYSMSYQNGNGYGRGSPRRNGNGPIAEDSLYDDQGYDEGYGPPQSAGLSPHGPGFPPSQVQGYGPAPPQHHSRPSNRDSSKLAQAPSHEFQQTMQQPPPQQRRQVIPLGGEPSPMPPGVGPPRMRGDNYQPPMNVQQPQQRPGALTKTSSQQQQEKGKRQSWFKKKFGKNND